MRLLKKYTKITVNYISSLVNTTSILFKILQIKKKTDK